MSSTECCVALSQIRLVMIAPDSTKMSVLAMYSNSSLHKQHCKASQLYRNELPADKEEQLLCGVVPHSPATRSQGGEPPDATQHLCACNVLRLFPAAAPRQTPLRPQSDEAPGTTQLLRVCSVVRLFPAAAPRQTLLRLTCTTPQTKLGGAYTLWPLKDGQAAQVQSL